MSREKTVGLLLQAIAYLGQKKILKILTPENGLISLFATRKTAPILTTPFVFAEWVYQKNQKEIHPLNDATLLDDLSMIKTDYSHLVAAGQIAQDLLRTQMPGKAAHEPLALALACLRKLPLFKQTPQILLAAFRLKLLSLEGLISELPPTLLELLLAKSFQQLASWPQDREACRQVDCLFEESF